MTFQIDIPPQKTKDVLAILKALDVKVKALKIPNSETVAAMLELDKGKGKKFKNVDELFNSIK